MLEHHGEAFRSYARQVPLFFPRLSRARLPGASAGKFSLAQYIRNHEYQAALGYLFLLIVLIAIWRMRTA